ncbi:MAG: carbohydrate ABC transporter permease [Vicinamibacterales bacterium]
MSGAGVPRSVPSWQVREARLGWALAAPALGVVGLVALVPVAWTVWDSLHLHDLRMPWLGRPWIGLANYVEAGGDPRFLGALGRTVAFAVVTVTLELLLGLGLALVLDRVVRGRGLVRTVVVLPWAIPTVVAALVWRFMFESPGGLASTVLGAAGLAPPTWFADPLAAWLPLIAADAWKTTPFVALLLLAGLQTIDRSLYEAAAVDGASPWQQFIAVTLPLLMPSLVVAGLFRALDAFRVFDVVYVMTAGGPGTATETVALYTFSTLLQHLRFGYGSALSVVTFALAFGAALVAIRLLGAGVLRRGEP